MANHIFKSVTGRTPDGIQGTTWWDVETDDVPNTVDPDVWAALAGASLADLAKQFKGARRDWTSLHTLLGAIPSAGWTTYGDVASVIGSHAVPVGTHLATSGQCPNAWRVLTASGRVSAGFQWTDPKRTDSPADVLAAEGVRFDGGAAVSEAHLSLEALRSLLDG
ncbi:hypothetical protein ACFYO2_28855 [Streptomyces sp. NPDC006602]|uniref:hypothetical protein n=1 Tax=Streptomyces sp. NPDC006602 TaxID=3364751 RepID=UPI0036B30568